MKAEESQRQLSREVEELSRLDEELMKTTELRSQRETEANKLSKTRRAIQHNLESARTELESIEKTIARTTSTINDIERELASLGDLESSNCVNSITSDEVPSANDRRRALQHELSELEDEQRCLNHSYSMLTWSVIV